jgi:RHS repeat-associated protein
MNLSSLGHSRSTGSTDPSLEQNMREGETYGSWVWAAESPRGATDQDGRVPKSAAQSSVGLKYLYASRPWSPVAEAYHNRARWHSPEAGRFLARDPIGYLGGVNAGDREWGAFSPLLSTPQIAGQTKPFLDSVVPDNVFPGRSSVRGVTPEKLQQAVIDRGKLPR